MSKPSSASVLVRGSVLALERVPFAASAHILPPTAGAHNPLVTRFEVGWACAVPSDIEKLDDATVMHLTRWYEEGQRSGKTKCSAARAIERLCALCDVDGSRLYSSEEVPSEKRIKRFFSSLAQKARDAARLAALSL